MLRRLFSIIFICGISLICYGQLPLPDTVDVSDYPELRLTIGSEEELREENIQLLEDGDEVLFDLELDTAILYRTGVFMTIQPSLRISDVLRLDVRLILNSYFLENNSKHTEFNLLSYANWGGDQYGLGVESSYFDESIDLGRENVSYVHPYFGVDNYLLLRQSLVRASQQVNENSYDSLHLVMLYSTGGLYEGDRYVNDIISLAEAYDIAVFGLELQDANQSSPESADRRSFQALFSQTGGRLYRITSGEAFRTALNQVLSLPARQNIYELSFESKIAARGQRYQVEVSYGQAEKQDVTLLCTLPTPQSSGLNWIWWALGPFGLFLFWWWFRKRPRVSGQEASVNQTEPMDNATPASSSLPSSNLFSSVVIGSASHVGMVREANEDYYGSFDTPNGYLFLVCDGMGGHVGGAQASQLAVNTIGEYLMNHSFEDPQQALSESLYAANRSIVNWTHQHPELKGMGATCVMLLLRDKEVYYAHVGDSRIYLQRDQRISQLTKDDSFVQFLIDSGEITEEQAATHPRRSQITNALGLEDMRPPHLAPAAIQVLGGDYFLLCSDGLTSMVKDDRIQTVINSSLSVQSKADKLVEKANKAGGLDNTTVQLIHFVT